MDEMKSFEAAMLEEAFDYNATNLQVLEFDEPLAQLENELRAAMATGDAKTARWTAREIHRYLIANGYADEDELPREG